MKVLDVMFCPYCEEELNGIDELYEHVRMMHAYTNEDN